jgi:hypothetical protein
MRGRKPSEYRLQQEDRDYLNELLCNGLLPLREAKRVQALLALDRGERIEEIVHWIGLSRGAVWYLWQRYQERGVEAIFDADRSGRPVVFSLAGARAN